MSWISLNMKFPGTCLVCGEKIAAGEKGLWQKGKGVKHEGCAVTPEIRCTVCGGPAGCVSCEFADVCALDSATCICAVCADKADAFTLCLDSAAKRHPVLNVKI